MTDAQASIEFDLWWDYRELCQDEIDEDARVGAWEMGDL